MRFDWGKIILYLLGLIIAQRLVFFLLSLTGLSGFTLLFVFEFIISFLFTYLYYPSYNRKYALKDPSFYKNWGIFLIVLLLLDLI